MNGVVAALFRQLQERIRELVGAGRLIEIAEGPRQISFHAPYFFCEVLPRIDRVLLLVPIALRRVDDLRAIVGDTTEWTSFHGSKRMAECPVYVRLTSADDLAPAMEVVRRAFDFASNDGAFVTERS